MVVSRYLTDIASASTASDIQLGSCVTEIGDGAFSGYTNITDVELPDALTKIGASAFNHSSVRTVDIPDGVTALKEKAFYECGNLSSCTIGSGVTYIGKDVFSYCINLKRINSETDGICNLPSSLEKIDGENFFYCNNIRKINVPDSIKIIGDGTFRYCENLEECTIGSGITNIGDNIFTGCTKMNKVRVTAPTPPSIQSGTFRKQGDNAYGNYQIYVPCESYDAYTGATNWSNYKSRIVCDNMPYKVKFFHSDGSYGGLVPCDESTRLSDTAVTNAWNDEYTKIEIGNCITEIYKAFKGRTGITEVVWDTSSASTITTIQEGFSDLSNATFPSTLPPNLQTINSGSFNGCHLDNVTLTTGMTIGGGSMATGGAFNGSVIGNLVYDVNTNAMGTFMDATISSLTIGNNVTSIPKYTFNGIKGLTALTIPSNVTSIGNNNFESSSLINATIPAATVDNSNFRFSFSLRKITIDSGATLNGSGQTFPFYGCSALTTINSDEEGKANLNISNFNTEAFKGLGFSELTLGSNVTTIGNKAFSECRNLQKVHIIGNSSTQIGSGFTNNPNLEEVVIDNCANYDARAFMECNNLKKITIDSGVTATNLCFSGKTSLTNAVFKYGYSDKILDATFSGCTSLSSVTIPPSVTSIGNSAFTYCTSIKDINFIPYSVTNIGSYAFYRCSGFTRIIIPTGVTSIGNYAFNECTNATVLTIPNTVLSIGNYAFMRCTNLSSIVVEKNIPPTIGASVFSYSNCPIYVPQSGYELYVNAENWSAYANRIEAISF